MYPAFAADVYHYALTCDDSELQVTATAKRSAAQLTVPHYYDQHTVTSVGSIGVEIDVHHNDDIVIHVSDTDERATYIVHCLPDDFPEFRVLTKTDQVSAGQLFVMPRWRSLGSNLDEDGAYGAWPEDFGDIELAAEEMYLDAVAQRNGI